METTRKPQVKTVTKGLFQIVESGSTALQVSRVCAQAASLTLAGTGGLAVAWLVKPRVMTGVLPVVTTAGAATSAVLILTETLAFVGHAGLDANYGYSFVITVFASAVALLAACLFAYGGEFITLGIDNEVGSNEEEQFIEKKESSEEEQFIEKKESSEEEQFMEKKESSEEEKVIEKKEEEMVSKVEKGESLSSKPSSSVEVKIELNDSEVD